jgi:Lon protease-like protein
MKKKSILLVQVYWLLLSMEEPQAFQIGASAPGRIRFSALRAKQREVNSDLRLTIPIFPLRKKVRLPTESLTLNLYEERYLAMCEYILREKKYPMFGTIYSSNMPQVIKAGIGPIVPMLSEGDVGVLCLVENSQEGLIPTRGGEERRRIRLQARGAVRFEVTRILHNGCGQDVPFILAEAKLLLDADNDSSDEQRVSEMSQELAKLKRPSFGAEDDQFTSVEQCRELALQASEALKLDDVQGLEAEILSFALATSVLPETASQERLQSIRSKNIASRMEDTKLWLGRWR